MMRLTYVLLFLLFVCIGRSGQAESWFVEGIQFKGEEIKEQAHILRELIISELEDDQNEISDSRESAENRLQLNLFELNSGMILRVNASGRKMKKRVVKIKIKSDQEFERVAKRLVRALKKKTNFEDALEVGEAIHADNADHSSTSSGSFGLSFAMGPSLSYGLGHEAVMQTMSLGMSSNYVDDAIGLVFNSTSREESDDLGIAGFGIEYTRYFSRRDVAPFLTTGFLIGGATIPKSGEDAARRSMLETRLARENAGSPAYEMTAAELDAMGEAYDEKSGFILALGGGLALMHTRSLQFEAAFVHQFLLDKLKDKIPGSAGFTIGIRYRN